MIAVSELDELPEGKSSASFIQLVFSSVKQSLLHIVGDLYLLIG